MPLSIRPINKEDDPVICTIIKSVFEEHGINRPGTAYFEESLNHLSDFFTVKSSAYFIAEADDVICGGAGIYPTDGLLPDTCELVKMYLLPQARGKGLGKALLEQCIDFARQYHYHKIYLETMPELQKAINIYHQLGFELLPSALGNSGHYSCSIHMLKSI